MMKYLLFLSVVLTFQANGQEVGQSDTKDKPKTVSIQEFFIDENEVGGPYKDYKYPEDSVARLDSLPNWLQGSVSIYNQYHSFLLEMTPQKEAVGYEFEVRGGNKERTTHYMALKHTVEDGRLLLKFTLPIETIANVELWITVKTNIRDEVIRIGLDKIPTGNIFIIKNRD